MNTALIRIRDQQLHFVVLLSFITVFIAAYNKSFDLKVLAAGNKTAANQLVGIRNDLLQIISDLHIMGKRDIGA